MTRAEVISCIEAAVTRAKTRKQLYDELVPILKQANREGGWAPRWAYMHVNYGGHYPIGTPNYRLVYGLSVPDAPMCYTTIWLSIHPDDLPPNLWNAIADIPMYTVNAEEGMGMVWGWPFDPLEEERSSRYISSEPLIIEIG